jgi:hypothetical protein
MPKPPMTQGLDILEVSAWSYVQGKDFRGGYVDYCVGAPPHQFDEYWYREHGRQLAAAIMAIGIDPMELTFDQRVEWWVMKVSDGTIVP